MRSIHHLVNHVQTYGFRHKPLYTAGMMLFFWSLYDGLLTYILPLKLVENNFNKTEMGIIIGTSSIAGAIFDLVLSRFVKTPNFRRFYLLMLALSVIYILLLYGATLVWIYIAAMAIWGFYWDLYSFGNMDFVSRTVEKNEISSSFGVINVFKALGSLLAPLLAGLVIGEIVTLTPFILAGIMLGLAVAFYVVLLSFPVRHSEAETKVKRTTFITEVRLWKKISRQLLPILLLTLMIYVSDSIFWTIGPLFAEGESGLGDLGGLFLVAYLLPPLLFGWSVGNLTDRFGKKRTALFSFLIGSIFISALSFIQNAYAMLGVIFLGSSFISFSLPAISAAYSDYILETNQVEKEIEGVTDFFYNAGWVAGPMLGGIIANAFGDKQTFTIIGVASIIVTLILIGMTPKHITLKV